MPDDINSPEDLLKYPDRFDPEFVRWYMDCLVRLRTTSFDFWPLLLLLAVNRRRTNRDNPYQSDQSGSLFLPRQRSQRGRRMAGRTAQTTNQRKDSNKREWLIETSIVWDNCDYMNMKMILIITNSIYIYRNTHMNILLRRMRWLPGRVCLFQLLR